MPSAEQIGGAAARRGSDFKMTPDILKLTDQSFFAEGDPYALWRRLRVEDPVAWTPEANGPGFWSVTRYEDGVRVFKNWATFSSARATVLTGNRWEANPAAGRMLALTDPPRHTQMRRIIMNRFFTPQRVKTLEGEVNEYARELVRGGAERGDFDFVEEVASRLPVGVFFTMLDIPAADWDSLLPTVLSLVSSSETEQQLANTELLLYFTEMVAARRVRPGDDLVSMIATMEVEGARLSDEDAVLNCLNIFSAGVDTTRLSAAGGLQALLEHPEQLELLRADSSLLPLAVEEIVRWTSPAAHQCRTATGDVEIAGRQIRRGDCVVVWIPSLNRDESVFHEPETFASSRRPNRHVGFGIGEHSCIGAALARLELRALFAEIMKGWGAVTLTGAPRRLHSNILHGVDYLPVRVSPA